MAENIINNNILSSIARKAAPPVLAAIKQASARTGVNFAYLMEQAAAESSFNPAAQSRHSSAAGLYQFIESTWLSVVKKYGHKYGLGHLADQISSNGKVSDHETRRAILELRKDPEKAAMLAAELAGENKRYLQQQVGGEIGSTELYFAHFMGASGASGFLNAMKENPLQAAADLFPKEARANHNVFYDSKGQPRTLSGVYDFFAKKFGASDGMSMDIDAPQTVAQNKVQTRVPLPPRRGIDIEQAVSAVTLNPFARMDDEREPAPLWRMTPYAPRGSLIVSPAQLMMMAEMDLPTDGRR